MKRTDLEIAETARFDEVYSRGVAPLYQRIVDKTCCDCGYVGTSWATVSEADEIAARLRLGPGVSLLDMGAGAGWPGLYLARKSGCHVTLLDLPRKALSIAHKRAESDGMADRVQVQHGDAADPPFRNESFDAINHSDLLCCLVRKSAVLRTCRRLIAAGGRMAFTVIGLAPGLSADERLRALGSAPQFVEAKSDYGDMLRATDWHVIERRDISREFEETCRRRLAAEQASADELAADLGEAEVAERLTHLTQKVESVSQGLTTREFFVAEPV